VPPLEITRHSLSQTVAAGDDFQEEMTEETEELVLQNGSLQAL
jgi:hypothetical protein